MNNDLVMEQYFSPASPLLAGFRLDAFTAIKPRLSHSPSSAHIWDTSGTLLEDRHVSPAILYIQVSVFQVIDDICFISQPLYWDNCILFYILRQRLLLI